MAKLINNKKVCFKISVKQGVNLPKKGSNVQVSDYHKHEQAPLVIDVEFESNLKENQKLNKDNTDTY